MTIEDALALAERYGLTAEVEYLINEGYSPEDALSEWDIL